MRLPLRQARLPSRIMRLEMSGYMEVTAAVAAAAPIAIPAINAKGFIDSHPLYKRLINVLCSMEVS